MGLDAVAVAVDGLDVIHAAVADGGYLIKFTPFLVFPNSSGAAAGHQPGHTIVHTIGYVGSVGSWQPVDFRLFSGLTHHLPS